MTLSPNVSEEVRALARLGLDDLRRVWRNRYGPPPSLRSADLLRRLLAWKMQAELQGGLGPDTLRLLRAGGRRGPELGVGARLIREWKGERHEVEISAAGVLYRGRIFRTLSEAAREITGVRWNGPRFFGLRMKEEQP